METKDLLKALGIEKENATDDEIKEFIKSRNDEKVKLSAEIDNIKALISKRNSEIAELKKKHNDAMTDEEKHKEYVATLEKQNADLEKKLKINEVKAKYLTYGYTDEEAEKCSKASAENNFDLLAKYQNEHEARVIEKLKAEMLKGTPNPQGGNGTGLETRFTKENFKKGVLSMEELTKLQQENPQLFDEITK